jgi:hypothetical protein
MSPGGKRSSEEPAGAPQNSIPASTPVTLAVGPTQVLARGLLCVLPLLLPFEAPLFHLGPLTITTAELGLYAVLLAWGLGVAGNVRATWARLRSPDPLGRAVLAWLAVMVVAAAAAPAYRAEAVKFVLRSLGGALLFFAARDVLVRSEEQARPVILAVVAGALISALAALADVLFPTAAWLWRPFRSGAFTATGLPRAAGAFAYPTIAAMYWEAAVALLLVAPWRRERRPWPDSAIAVMGVGVLVAAILVSATRTALVGAAAACAAMLLLRWPGTRGVRRAAAGSLALIAVVVAATFLPGDGHSLLAQRLHFWRDDSWFKARYAFAEAELRLPAGRQSRVKVTVQNTGTLVWPQGGRDPVHLSYHWEKTGPKGPELDFEGRRTPLPRDLGPGESVELLALLRTPPRAGRYRLRWDLVREHVTWFSERGSPPGDQWVDVVAAGAPSNAPYETVSGSLEDWVLAPSPMRGDLWEAAVILAWRHPLLGVGPDNFRRRYPEVVTPDREGRKFTDDRMHANNLYLETAADLGAFGLAALAFLMFTFARAVHDQARQRRYLALACGVAAGTFFLHGLLDYFLEFTPAYGLYWLLLALAAPLPRGAPAASPDSTP